ncbi:MAG: SDR family NAD(P)-dependent oxidoreductase [Pirellulales bacterium]
MPGNWENKVVIVTGGSRGLGYDLAGKFSDAGAKVTIAARDPDALAQAAAKLREGGADVLTVPTDVTVQAEVDEMIRQTLDRYGRIDVLINNAGKSTRGKIVETTAEQFAELLTLNFLGLVRCTRAAIPHLLLSQGHVVNIGSLSSKVASPYMGAYPASKFSVAAYSQQLRLELGPQGLHVLLVCPGPLKRPDAATRFRGVAQGLPDEAYGPGGGARLSLVSPEKLAKKVIKYCERRRPELVVPGKVKWLLAISAMWPRVGDWLVRKNTEKKSG